MPIFDVTCAGCGTKLGEVEHSEQPDYGDAHACKDCFLAQHEGSEWLHVDQHPTDVQHMSPVGDVIVHARNIVEDRNHDADDELTLALVHHDLRDGPIPMLMGSTHCRMVNGRAVFTGLYVRGTGCFRFRVDASGHEPTYTLEFRVT
jgi:hypothetical protein